MSRIKRLRPSTEEDRKRASELRRIIASGRSSKADKAAAEHELDTLAPRLTKRAAKEPGFGSPNDLKVSKPSTKDPLNLCDRVEARREGSVSKSILSSWTSLPDPTYRERAICRAEAATAQEKAAVILSELPDHPLQKLARELAEYLWLEDRSNPRPSVEALTAQWTRHWVSRVPYNLHDIRGNRETVANAVADVYRLLAGREAADPGWYVRRAEKLFDELAPPAVKTERAPEPEPPQAFSASSQEEARPSPIEKAGLDIFTPSKPGARC